MMKNLYFVCIFLGVSLFICAQTNNPTSIYEGFNIHSTHVHIVNPPADTLLLRSRIQEIQQTFAISQNSQYSAILSSFYTSKVNLLPFVSSSSLSVTPTSENQLTLTLNVVLSEHMQGNKSENSFISRSLLPVIYNSRRTFITLRAAASEMAYTNHNTWFGQPANMTAGNPLADSPSGKGWSAWVEGFTSLGVYGVLNLIPKINFHLYAGGSYLISFSAGNELFTNRARIHGAFEDAYVGIVGGGHISGNKYLYNMTYGRKSFTLGEGWLIINTSMNGSYRGALQLNPRWASKELLTGSFQWKGIMLQGFMLKPNELSGLDSKTTLVGFNLQLYNKHNGILGLSYVTVPSSHFRYYLPDGTTHTREGLEVYNLRIFKTTSNKGGIFFKSEVGYERNRHFDMNAWAYYAELGWNFAKVKGRPTLSYRYACFPGDNTDTKSYNRWDALYTGGNGEQWVQGSNMYKIVQNSNEITHRIQAVYSPTAKIQLVGQFWLFYANRLNNLGGNPALSTLTSKFYGTEYNLTVKFFHSRSWYFHFNTAYTIAGSAIKNNIPPTKNWYSATLFARYSF